MIRKVLLDCYQSTLWHGAHPVVCCLGYKQLDDVQFALPASKMQRSGSVLQNAISAGVSSIAGTTGFGLNHILLLLAMLALLPSTRPICFRAPHRQFCIHMGAM